MTPEQLAREMDRLAFEADCRSARERAYAHIARRDAEHAARIAKCMGHSNANGLPTQHKRAFTSDRDRQPGRQVKLIEFRGLTLTAKSWAQSTGISLSTLHNRFRAGWDIERALTTPAGAVMGRPRKTGRGVASNFAEPEGTGAGGVARDISEMEFSK